ncbi:MAG: rhodanese-like domain-containing protein, partial [Desulfovibrionaceae bacterium]|nr:rhodanese-like domain-containing protein [Desulfovibrionaceae bacterium]
MPNIQYNTPQEAKQLFGLRGEFAVLDVREQEEFSRSHMLLASCAPLSRLEMMVLDLVPCKCVPVILVDSGEETSPSRAERAAAVLIRLGYLQPRVLRGGMNAWLAAGYVEFTGVGALSKGFGEYVEEEQRTPRLEPREIKTIMDSGEPFVVIDVRPREEYSTMNIPGGINAPGCEVTHRIADLAPDPATTIIINCAGRTRSIIGAQTLRNAGIPNNVAALKGGTMNWQLAGYSLEYGTQRSTAPPSPAALDIARQRA